MAGRVYVNLTSGEVTRDREKAFFWYRDTNAVDVYQNGKFIFGFRI